MLHGWKGPSRTIWLQAYAQMIFLQALLYVHPHGWIITQWYKLAQEPNLFRNIRTKWNIDVQGHI